MLTSSIPGLSLETIQPYPQYYRAFGVRRAVQLAGPTLISLQRLELPRDSILHYIPEDESVLGIPQDEPVLQHSPRLIMVHHNIKLGDEKGVPRKTMLPASSMIRDYHRKYRLTRNLINYDTALRDPRTIIVENYGLLPHLYRYPTNYFRPYFKWWNMHAAMFERVQELATQVPNRQQYLVCHLPQLLPSLKMLLRGEASMTRAMLAAFSDSDAMFILELWKWLGPKRAESVFSKASPEALAKLNLIFVESGKWTIVNLGLLDQWRTPTEEEEKHGAVASKQAIIAPAQLQKRVLRLLMFLFEARTSAEPESEVTIDKVQKAPVEEEGKVATRAVILPIPEQKPLKVKIGMDVDHLPEEHLIEESEANIKLLDASITKDLEALDHLHNDLDEAELAQLDEVPKTKKTGTPVTDYVPDEPTLEEGVMNVVNRQADQGQLSGAEYRRFQTLSKAYQHLRDPHESGKSLVEAMHVTPQMLALPETPRIPDIDTVVDKSMLKSTLLDFDSRYIEHVMRPDILRSVVNLQQAGVAITSYQVEQHQDALGESETHIVQLTPVQGKASTVRFTVPKIKPDGTFRSGGVRYRLRKQRGDMPIRKLSPSRVALTSYYSKIFVTRSEKQVHNYAGWFTNQIAAIGMDPTNDKITNLMLSNVFDSNNRTPRIYSMMAQRFRSFSVGKYDFFFDYAAREAQFGAEAVKAAEKHGMVVVGRHGKTLLVVDKANALYAVYDDELKLLGSTGQLEEVLGVSGRAPLEMVEVKVFNKFVPLGIFLAHHMGLSRLLQLLKVNPRRALTGERTYMADDEYALRFEDEVLIFSREDLLATQILSGIAAFEKSTRNYPIHLFDKKDIYFNVLEQAGIGVRYLREMELSVNLFVDPITKEILQEMGEPTDLIGLLLRANELLLTDWSPDETDMAHMRIKGYERIAGAVYSELVKALRVQRARGANSRNKIEMAPYTVWQAILQNDSALRIVEETNPIHNLKETEEVTFSGTGGRSDRSMTAGTRVFHQSDMGVISEATKDSAAVAITTFLTADPNLKNLRGITKPYDPKTTGPASLLSSSALLAPAADRDDPKRVNFISIQQSAGTFAKGYRALPLRTGYEQIIAHRTDDIFAQTAKGEGTVAAVSNKAITVTYKDGTETSVELGRRFGVGSGEVFPHEVVTPLKVGDKVKQGDIVSYNSHYFELDPLDPTKALWKAGVLVKTAVMESTDTLEDSSAISQRTADLLETQTTKVRDIIVRFDQTIHNLVQPGAEVDIESILCTIEDAVTARSQLFDEDSLTTLRLLAANTPKAKFRGKVEKVEVFYHGELDDMSETLAELASESDRNRRKLARDLKVAHTPGRVDGAMRIEGRNLPFEQAVIRVYITGPMSAGVGDKGVFGNQLKTIFGRVMSGVNRTEGGEDIDAIFGYISISNRIVLSPELMGTTITLLKVFSKRVADVYRGKIK